MNTFTRIMTVAFLAFFAVGCSKKEGAVDNEQLVGTWHLQKGSVRVLLGGVPIPLLNEDFEKGDGNEEYEGLFMKFDQDGRFSTEDGPGGSYTLNGRTLTLDFGGLDAIVYDVNTLTKTNLIIISEGDVRVGDYLDDDVELPPGITPSTTVKVRMRLELKKQ